MCDKQAQKGSLGAWDHHGSQIIIVLVLGCNCSMGIMFKLAYAEYEGGSQY